MFWPVPVLDEGGTRGASPAAYILPLLWLPIQLRPPSGT